MNDTNYVLQKSAKDQPFIVHVDHMRNFPNEDALNGFLPEVVAKNPKIPPLVHK